MKNTAPQLSVVIPTYNRADILMTSLERLDSDQSRADFEIIVVSDGATDDTAARVSSQRFDHPVRLVEQPNQGAAAARNHGASLARADHVLFLDDDMRAADGLIDAHVAAFDGDVDAVVGRIGHDPASPRTILGRYVERWANDFHQQLLEHGVTNYEDVLSGHVAVSKTIFEALGGFDENFTEDGRYGNEDLDFAIRLLESGATVTYCAEARADQYYAVTAAARLQQARDLARADALLAQRGGNGAELFEQRKVGPGKVENPVLNRLSRLHPGVAWHVAWPLRKTTERLVDGGRAHRLVHHWFGVHQGLAYRLGLSEAGLRLDR